MSIDVKRCVLGVNGMDYSILLPRSTDYVASQPLTAFNPLAFDPSDPTSQIGYSSFLDFFYPDQSQRMLLFDLIQTLWDRSDPNGYAHHMTTDPLPNTPAHKVLLHEAFGDHQVANVATEIEARTIGASIHQPAIASGRSYEVTPYYGIPAIPSYPFDGSALIVWDSGAATPPTTNTAPMTGDDTSPALTGTAPITASLLLLAPMSSTEAVWNPCRAKRASGLPAMTSPSRSSMLWPLAPPTADARIVPPH